MIIAISFFHMLRFVRKDKMLLAAGISPMLMGLAIRFGIPAIEKLLVNFTGCGQVLAPYYGLVDILYAAITPAMFCFVAAMVILEEHDDHIDKYLFVTELGKSGYYVSRIVIPALAAFVVTLVLLPLFALAVSKAAVLISLALAGTLQGIIIALLVVKLSGNKLEGMALTKLSSLLMFGALGPYFMPKSYSFMLSFLPSYWSGMAVTEDSIIYMLPCILVSALWIFALTHVRKS
jgi:fluoroquinolone transport system permease protein